MLAENIQTDTFHRVVDGLKSDGWDCVDEYAGMDAWIDYGMLKFERNGIALVLEWTNWDEGSVDGPDDIVEALAQRYGFR